MFVVYIWWNLCNDERTLSYGHSSNSVFNVFYKYISNNHLATKLFAINTIFLYVYSCKIGCYNKSVHKSSGNFIFDQTLSKNNLKKVFFFIIRESKFINILNSKGELYYQPLPFMIYGACATLAAVLTFFFVPETNNCQLPNNIADTD